MVKPLELGKGLANQVDLTLNGKIEVPDLIDIDSSIVRAPVDMDLPPGSPRPTRQQRGNTIAERYQRLAFAARCQVHGDDVVRFWYTTMMDERADMPHRIACSDRLMNRAYGMPVQVTHENVTENRKQVLEVRWLSPDPNDRSKVIEPEPD